MYIDINTLYIRIHTHTHTHTHTHIHSGSAGKESARNAGEPSSIPGLGLGRSARERIGYSLQFSWASLVTQLVKNPPAMWET